MSFLVLIYLILVTISFNILYCSGGYRKMFIKDCHKSLFLFAVSSTIVTLTGPFWILVGIVEALTDRNK